MAKMRARRWGVIDPRGDVTNVLFISFLPDHRLRSFDLSGFEALRDQVLLLHPVL